MSDSPARSLRSIAVDKGTKADGRSDIAGSFCGQCGLPNAMCNCAVMPPPSTEGSKGSVRGAVPFKLSGGK